ncbi:MAG: VCBS repeat-containing protein, partial [Planctomycetaceae bacterium]|nr:VCBS repeat-containing protein [Planctomycetaceae bacterium]
LPKTSDIVGFVNGDWCVSSQSSGTWTSTRWARWGASTLIDSVSGDFNGDGIDDIAGWTPDGGWWVGIAQPNGSFVTTKWAQWRTTDVKEIHVGDFNGDGKDDIAGLFKRSGTNKGDWWIAESTGSSFASNKRGTFGNYSGIDTVLIGDFDGTGRDDIAVMTSGGEWWTYLSQVNTFSVSFWTRWNVTSGVNNILVGDFDGNGTDDVAGLFGTGTSRDWWVGLSTASSFLNEKWETWAVSSTLNHVLAGDFNGDGATDIAGVFGPLNLQVAIAGQNQFSTSSWGMFSAANVDVNVGDSNGDGMADVFGRASDGWWYTAESDGNSFDLNRIVKWSAAANWQNIHIANFDSRVPASPASPFSPASSSLAYAAPTSSESGKDEENAKQQSIASRSVAVSGSSSSDDTNSSSSDDSNKKDQETQQSSSDSTSEFEAFGDSDLLDLLHQV